MDNGVSFAGIREEIIMRDNSDYTGKIINIAEFNGIKNKFFANLPAAAMDLLTLPFTLAGTLFRLGRDEYLPAPSFYVEGKTAEKYQQDPYMTAKIVHADNEKGYFEASSLLSLLDQKDGKGLLSRRFMRAIKNAPDHRDLLLGGQIVPAGFSMHIDGIARDTTFSAIIGAKGGKPDPYVFG